MPDKFIPLSVPNLKGRELELVTEAVETEWVSTAGPFVDRFEADVACYVGAPGAVSCQNGTSGLHVSLLLSGVRPGDLVVVPALTFIAAVNPVRYLGADPVFMDCDGSLCMDPAKLERFCAEKCEVRNGELFHRESGRRIPAAVVVHVFGNMADMEAILATCRHYNLKLVEDATEALGTRYESGALAGRHAGTMGDFGVYSFNGNKIITTGGGGMVVSGNAGMLARAKHLTTQAKSDAAYFEHDEVGFNYRMTNLQAALGIAQLEQLEGFIAVKERNWEAYRSLLDDVAGCRLLPFREGVRSNRWFYALALEGGAGARDAVISHLASRGIQSRPVWGIICDQAPYRGSAEFEVAEARRWRESIVNLPCSTNLAPEDAAHVAEAVLEVLR